MKMERYCEGGREGFRGCYVKCNMVGVRPLLKHVCDIIVSLSC